MILSILSVLSIILIIAIYKWGTHNDNYFEKKGIDFIKPSFVLGGHFDILSYRTSMPDLLKRWGCMFQKKKIFGFFDHRNPVFIIRDPEMIKQLTIKDYNYFINRSHALTERADPIMGKALVVLPGQRWREMRSTLSPVFTSNRMMQMFHLISECARQMIKFCLYEDANDKSQIYEMKSFYGKAANDVIATCAFGMNVNSFENPDNIFYKMARKITEFRGYNIAMKFLSYRGIPELMSLFEMDLVDISVKKFFYNIIMDTMRTRLDFSYIRKDLIDLFVMVKNGKIRRSDETVIPPDIGYAVAEEIPLENESKKILTDDDIVAQSLMFFFAGYDTIANLLAFTSYELAINELVQEKLYQEVRTAYDKLGGRTIGYNDLQEMKYLDMVISESLRKWPPTIHTSRRCAKDYLYDDGVNKFVIEKGISIWIPIISLHHDPNYFKNPEKFDPERFSDDNKKHIKVGTYLPFGAGFRNCIGSRLALMEAKIILFYMLLHFKMAVTHKTQIPLQYAKIPLTNLSAKGIWLQLIRR